MKLTAAVQARWDTLAAREKTLIRSALALVGVAVLWWLCLAPALQTLRSANDQHRSLETQLQQMKNLQVQAQSLQSQHRLGYDEALRALQASVKPLGTSAQLSVVGERATVTLKGAPADALAQWLAQVRVNARALPTEARLTRRDDSPRTANWDGTLVLILPAR